VLDAGNNGTDISMLGNCGRMPVKCPSRNRRTGAPGAPGAPGERRNDTVNKVETASFLLLSYEASRLSRVGHE
jgi:hypothetical protein